MLQGITGMPSEAFEGMITLDFYLIKCDWA